MLEEREQVTDEGLLKLGDRGAVLTGIFLKSGIRGLTPGLTQFGTDVEVSGHPSDRHV